MNKYLILLIILLVSAVFLVSTSFNKVTGFATKVFQGEPDTLMKVLSDENNNTVKTLKGEIFVRIIADKDNCIDNNFIIYKDNKKIKEIKLADKQICETTTIKYRPDIAYDSYTLTVKDVRTGKELKSDFIL